MVCWLFVGSAIFSAAFALLGGQEIIERWVLSLDLTPLQFMILAQFIIFILGWPLEWTEIIVIFMPIFIPLLAKFNIDPLFFGLLVALNLQTAFLSPPVAMAAFYLKGVAPPHVTLNQIFAGMMPFMGSRSSRWSCSTCSPASACGCRRCSTSNGGEERSCITRGIFPEVVESLAQRFEVEHNAEDRPWPPEELARRLQGKHGAMATVMDKFDEPVIGAVPRAQGHLQHRRGLQQHRRRRARPSAASASPTRRASSTTPPPTSPGRC